MGLQTCDADGSLWMDWGSHFLSSFLEFEKELSCLQFNSCITLYEGN